MIRVQQDITLKDLDKKLVLIVGPRQSGKTHLAKEVSKFFNHSIYLNYDQIKDRRIIEDQAWLDKTDLLILDELHKMPNWKNYLKGIFDTKPNNMRILVTGSARLDMYDKIGDSLAGRYFRHRLMPISMAELKQSSMPLDIDRLLERGGFPEPYFSKEEDDAKRWQNQYINSLLSTDIFEIETINNLKGMRLVFDLLRNRVGSPISYQSLSEDVGVSPVTIKKYIQILEAVFVVFVVTPYSRNIARSILKEPKIYFFDTSLVQAGDGASFENLVAVSLLKSIYARQDIKGEDCSLHYLRTKDGHEVDFAVIKDDKVEVMIEAKLSQQPLSKSLMMLHDKYGYKAIQLTKNLRNEFKEKDIEILKAESYLPSLYL